MRYEQELGVILDQIPTENVSFFVRDIQILSKREFGQDWSELSVDDAWLLVTNYREEIPEVWSVLPEDAINLEEGIVEVCEECGTEVNDDMTHCPACKVPLDWDGVDTIMSKRQEDTPNLAEAAATTVIKSLKVEVEGKVTIGDREKEVSTIEDTP